MDFNSFVEGPLVWIAFLTAAICIITRGVFFIYSIFVSAKGHNPGVTYIIQSFMRSVVPFHAAVVKKPFYAIVRYIFHLCLIVVPIWLAGHIYLWEASRFNWTWVSLPDSWADGMSLVVIVVAIYFLFRRIVVKDIRRETSAANYVLLIITVLPFMTGYFLVHGSLDSVAFLADNMRLLHILSGEALMFGAAVLFLKTRLDKATCTGCASCGLICPTSALSYADVGTQRSFDYELYQCIGCGACVGICPEEAAALHHHFSFKELLQPGSRQKIGAVELMACQKCGQLFAPEAQVQMVGRKVSDDYLRFCLRCKGKVMTQEL